MNILPSKVYMLMILIDYKDKDDFNDNTIGNYYRNILLQYQRNLQITKRFIKAMKNSINTLDTQKRAKRKR